MIVAMGNAKKRKTKTVKRKPKAPLWGNHNSKLNNYVFFDPDLSGEKFSQLSS